MYLVGDYIYAEQIQFLLYHNDNADSKQMSSTLG